MWKVQHFDSEAVTSCFVSWKHTGSAGRARHDLRVISPGAWLPGHSMFAFKAWENVWNLLNTEDRCARFIRSIFLSKRFVVIQHGGMLQNNHDVLKRIPFVYPISDIAWGKLRLPLPDRQHSGFLENLFLSNAYLAHVEQELNRTLLFWLLSQHITTVHDSHKVALILSHYWHDHFFNI